jgi:hypothetical protein
VFFFLFVKRKKKKRFVFFVNLFLFRWRRNRALRSAAVWRRVQEL